MKKKNTADVCAALAHTKAEIASALSVALILRCRWPSMLLHRASRHGLIQNVCTALRLETSRCTHALGARSGDADSILLDQLCIRLADRDILTLLGWGIPMRTPAQRLLAVQEATDAALLRRRCVCNSPHHWRALFVVEQQARFVADNKACTVQEAGEADAVLLERCRVSIPPRQRHCPRHVGLEGAGAARGSGWTRHAHHRSFRNYHL